MQKNLGYVIPSIVVEDSITRVGQWYLGDIPLGFRATGTIWTIGADHYWYCDNVKTNYLAEIPVESYNQTFNGMITDYGNQFTEFMDQNYSNFSTWFNHIKNQLTEDAAGHLQNEINDLSLDVIGFGEKITTTAMNGTITEVFSDGRKIETTVDVNDNIVRKYYKDNVLIKTHQVTINDNNGTITETLQ